MIFFIIVAFCCSIISQFPFVLTSGMDGLFKMIWILLFPIALLKNGPKIFNVKIINLWLLFGAFNIFIFICQIINVGASYFVLGGDSYNILISFLILTVSYGLALNCNIKKYMPIMVLSIVVVSFVLSFYIYVDYIAKSNITDMEYAYSAKNSSGQILLGGAMIGTILWMPKKIWFKLPYIAMILFIVLVMFMLKSRATLVGFAFVILYSIIKSKRRSLRFALIFGVLLLILVLMFDQKAYDVIVNSIIYGGRDGYDMDSVSSGRLTFIRYALRKINDHPIVGNGAYYVDCMPINMVVQYGFIGLIFIATLLLMVYGRVKKLQFNCGLGLVVFLLFMVYMINSLFEAYTPFGPGMKCFELWSFLGIALAEHQQSMACHGQMELYQNTTLKVGLVKRKL